MTTMLRDAAEIDAGDLTTHDETAALTDGPLRRRPRIVGSPLNPPFEGFLRARRGEHRIRCRVDERRRLVEVVAVDHRRDACGT